VKVLGFQRHDVRLTLNLFKRRLRERYLGSMLGLAWAVLQPVLLLGLYTFVFGFIFNPSKLPNATVSLTFVIWLIAGFVPYLALSEGLMQTASSVISGAGLVKNIVFKTEIMPIASTLLAAVPFAVGMSFLMVLLILQKNYPTWHAIFLAPVVLLQFAFLAGLGLFLGATAVFVRDVVQVLPTVSLIILFGTPIFYPVERLPHPVLQKLTLFNPFYQMIYPYRAILVDHTLPDPKGQLYLAGVTAILFLTGLWYFRRLKGYFEMAL